MWARRSIAFALVVLLLLVALGNRPDALSAQSPTGSTPTPPVSSTASPATLTPMPSSSATAWPTPVPTIPSITRIPPPNVILTLKPSSTISQTVVTLDGTQFTLTVPKGTVLQEQTITLTLVSRVANLALSGRPAVALYIAPEGLVLYKAATLLVEPSTRIPVAEQISFAYQGTGQDLHLFPLTRDPATLTFQLTHFGGYGIGQGTDTDVKNILEHSPSSEPARAESRLGATLRGARANHAGALADTDLKDIGNTLNDWYNDGVQRDLAAAEMDPSRLDAATGELLQWSWQVQSFDMVGRFSMQMEAARRSLAQGMLRAISQANQTCNAGRMVQLSQRAAQLALESYQPQLSSASLLDQLHECQVFVLEVSGRQGGYGKDGNTSVVVPLTKIPLSWMGEEPVFGTMTQVFEGHQEITAQWDPPLHEPCYTFVDPINQTWAPRVKGTNDDVYFHANSQIQFYVEISRKDDLTATDTCGNGGTVPNYQESITPVRFKLVAQDGFKFEWTPEGTTGSITFTFRDPTHYLETMGAAK